MEILVKYSIKFSVLFNRLVYYHNTQYLWMKFLRCIQWMIFSISLSIRGMSHPNVICWGSIWIAQKFPVYLKLFSNVFLYKKSELCIIKKIHHYFHPSLKSMATDAGWPPVGQLVYWLGFYLIPLLKY